MDISFALIKFFKYLLHGTNLNPNRLYYTTYKDGIVRLRGLQNFKSPYVKNCEPVLGINKKAPRFGEAHLWL